MITIATTEKIKILLIKCGSNQKELAEKLGISQPALSKKFKLFFLKIILYHVDNT